jgi:hypothetical protein
VRDQVSYPHKATGKVIVGGMQQETKIICGTNSPRGLYRLQGRKNKYVKK